MVAKPLPRFPVSISQLFHLFINRSLCQPSLSQWAGGCSVYLRLQPYCWGEALASLSLMTNSALSFRWLASSSSPRVNLIFVQENLLKTMFQLEDTYFSLASTQKRNCLVICDRGAMDASAYLPREEWEGILEKNSLNEVDIRDNRCRPLTTWMLMCTHNYSGMIKWSIWSPLPMELRNITPGGLNWEKKALQFFSEATTKPGLRT